MMIGRMCRFYSFTDEHVLKMPIGRFFLLLESADRLEGRERAYQCYIARSAQVDQKAFETTVSYFMSAGSPLDEILPDVSEATVSNDPSPNQLPASSEIAKRSVMGLFANDPSIKRKVLIDPKPKHPRWRN